MRYISIVIVLISLATAACVNQSAQVSNISNTIPVASPEIPLPLAENFAYPLADGRKLTAKRDSADAWYNALDFGEDDHLGEDWNMNSGGNTDCGQSVYSMTAGRIVFAGNAGDGWGNVVIIEHRLKDDSRIQSLYGHLQSINKTSGDVGVREEIGKVGNADGRYFCHLHLELRTRAARSWNEAGGGYSKDRTGWLDASDFIDKMMTSR